MFRQLPPASVLLSALLSLLLSLLLPATPAYAVYKCASGDRVTYTDLACDEGKSLDLRDSRGVLKPTQNPTGNQKKTAAAEARRPQKYDERRQLAADKKKKKCALLAQRKKWAEDDQRSANLKSWEKARRKTQRATEHYLAECPA